MRYLALATDYDGTLAELGKVNSRTVAAVEKLRKSGRKLILVTGRRLDDLQTVFDRLDLFHFVVAENGALLYNPASKEVRTLCEPPAALFLAELQERKVPYDHGHCIVATVTPHETEVLEAIKHLGLELQVIFNKGAVMVLPTGTNKATGLKAVLDELGISAHNTVAVGDAENDHAFLSVCECSAAVANALPMLKERADVVLQQMRGEGVTELIEQLLEDDLRSFEPRLKRHRILLGHQLGKKKEERGPEVWLRSYGGSVLVAGPSGSGKSTITTGVLERLAEKGYQFLLVDPEGDYEGLPGALQLGDEQRAPSVDEVVKALESPHENVVVNLLGIALGDRPLFFAGLLPRLQELRARTARPHWIVVDEAHHMLPSAWVPAPSTVPQDLKGMLMITMQPEHVSAAALKPVDVVIAVGKQVERTLAGFARVLEVEAAGLRGSHNMEPGVAAAWFREEDRVLRVRPVLGHLDRKRHKRKYAEGELPEDRSFYFRGPEGKLNLRAQNLMLFAQMATGVDDDTWMFHLKRGDYSKWFRRYIKDAELAAEAQEIEKSGASAEESRERIKKAIEARYTAAA